MPRGPGASTPMPGWRVRITSARLAASTTSPSGPATEPSLLKTTLPEGAISSTPRHSGWVARSALASTSASIRPLSSLAPSGSASASACSAEIVSRNSLSTEVASARATPMVEVWVCARWACSSPLSAKPQTTASGSRAAEATSRSRTEREGARIRLT